jgi:hypothetical protein
VRRWRANPSLSPRGISGLRCLFSQCVCAVICMRARAVAGFLHSCCFWQLWVDMALQDERITWVVRPALHHPSVAGSVRVQSRPRDATPPHVSLCQPQSHDTVHFLLEFDIEVTNSGPQKPFSYAAHSPATSSSARSLVESSSR